MFKKEKGQGEESSAGRRGWGTGIGQGGRHSPYLFSAPIGKKPVRLRGGYVTTNMFLGKE